MLEPALNERIRRIDPLVSTLEASPDPQVRDASRELVATLLDYQAEGLFKIFSALAEAKQEVLIERIAREPVVESLLLLHGLHPDSLELRLERALDKARPALRAHKGDVEVLDLADGRLRLRLLGTCHGCPSSTTTFRNLIETSILELAPEIETILVEGLDFEAAPRTAEANAS